MQVRAIVHINAFSQAPVFARLGRAKNLCKYCLLCPVTVFSPAPTNFIQPKMQPRYHVIQNRSRQIHSAYTGDRNALLTDLGLRLDDHHNAGYDHRSYPGHSSPCSGHACKRHLHSGTSVGFLLQAGSFVCFVLNHNHTVKRVG
jgi:hypothetical protein